MSAVRLEVAFINVWLRAQASPLPRSKHSSSTAPERLQLRERFPDKGQEEPRRLFGLFLLSGLRGKRWKLLV